MSSKKSENKADQGNPYVRMRQYKGNNLYIIVDLNTCFWLEKKQLGIEGLLVLVSQTLNSHLIKSIHNSAYIYLTNSRESKMIFPINSNISKDEDSDQNRIDNLDYSEIQARIQKRTIEFMQQNMADNINYSKLIPALTQSLCKINKLSIQLEKKLANQIENEKYYSSILIFTVSEIHSSSYISLMSTIETAIKNKVKVYVFEIPEANLSDNTQDYLKQLCSLTQGYYLKINDEKKEDKKEDRKEQKKDDKKEDKKSSGSSSARVSINPFDLFNYISLLMLTSGDMLAKPEQQFTKNPVFRPAINEKVQFRVNCSCHNTPMDADIAYVCSDCLFLYCKQNESSDEVCMNCKQ
ncbi:hypothetical protein ABPG74_013917 [Tetrahymena malaccensis]